MQHFLSLGLGDGFLPAVQKNLEFQSTGILFGKDPAVAKDCHWVVIDPDRHKMFVWQKPSLATDFVNYGKSLRASVFTDGTMQHAVGEITGANPLLSKASAFANYLQGEVEKQTAHTVLGGVYGAARGVTYVADVLASINGDSKPFGQESPIVEVQRNAAAYRAENAKEEAKVLGAIDDRINAEMLVGPPFGSVFGKDTEAPNSVRGNRLINEHVTPTARVGYFGRKAGKGFGSYVIGEGNPPVELLEASGGLYPPEIVDGVVKPLQIVSTNWICWGLAPLQSAAAETKPSAGAGKGEAPAPAPTGLIIAVYYQGSAKTIQILKDIGVRDAIRIDGGDSCLLGYGNTVLIGDHGGPVKMSRLKRTWLQYGIAFFPVW